MDTYTFRKLALLAFILFQASCKQAPVNTRDLFLRRFQLKEGEQVYFVSKFSCASCIEENVIEKNNDVLIVFDTTNFSEFVNSLKRKRHIHLSQDSLDQIFGSFSNILTVTKQNDSFKIEKIHP